MVSTTKGKPRLYFYYDDLVRYIPTMAVRQNDSDIVIAINYFILLLASMHHSNSPKNLPALLSVFSLSAGVPSSW